MTVAELHKSIDDIARLETCDEYMQPPAAVVRRAHVLADLIGIAGIRMPTSCVPLASGNIHVGWRKPYMEAEVTVTCVEFMRVNGDATCDHFDCILEAI